MTLPQQPTQHNPNLTVALMIQRLNELAKSYEFQQNHVTAGYFREMADMATEINQPIQ